MGAEATEDATAAAPVTVEEVEERVQHGKNPPSARHKKTPAASERMSQGLTRRGWVSLPAPVRIAARIDDCRPAPCGGAGVTPPVGAHHTRPMPPVKMGPEAAIPRSHARLQALVAAASLAPRNRGSIPRRVHSQHGRGWRSQPWWRSGDARGTGAGTNGPGATTVQASLRQPAEEERTRRLRLTWSLPESTLPAPLRTPVDGLVLPDTGLRSTPEGLCAVNPGSTPGTGRTAGGPCRRIWSPSFRRASRTKIGCGGPSTG